MGIKLDFLNNELVIQNLPKDNQRKIMKFKIFLDSYRENLSYLYDSKSMSINFNSNDKNAISQIVGQFLKFLENTFDEDVCQTEEINKILGVAVHNKDEFVANKKRLNDEKNSSLHNNSNFINFSNFCNSSLSCDLRPYQLKAAYFLSIGNGGFDFSVPGSGKTIISYATYNWFKNNDVAKNVLIIGPINSSNAWHDEYFTVFNNNPDFENLSLKNIDEVRTYLNSSIKFHKEISFINVDKTWRLTDDIISFIENNNTLLIVDEAHKEKNPEAKITKSVMEISKFANARIVLTGTPMPNGYEDLYSITKIYSPFNELLPYKYPVLKNITKNGATEEQQSSIKSSIEPFYSRVSKVKLINDGELLNPKFDVVEVDMSDEQWEIYDFLRRASYSLRNDLDYEFNINLMKAVMIRKMQISANPGLLAHSIVNTIDEYKNEYYDQFNDRDINNGLESIDTIITNMVKESSIYRIVDKYNRGLDYSNKNKQAIQVAKKIIENGSNVIIWDVFVQNMELLVTMLNSIGIADVELINGSVNGFQRQVSLENFKIGKSRVLVANPATLAESVSLHKACQNAIYVNRNFNAAQFIQSKDRIHRINMPSGTTATYYYLINRDTIDEDIDYRLKIKENRMLQILDSDEIAVGGSDFEDNSFLSYSDIKFVMDKEDFTNE